MYTKESKARAHTGNLLNQKAFILVDTFFGGDMVDVGCDVYTNSAWKFIEATHLQLTSLSVVMLFGSADSGGGMRMCTNIQTQLA